VPDEEEVKVEEAGRGEGAVVQYIKYMRQESLVFRWALQVSTAGIFSVFVSFYPFPDVLVHLRFPAGVPMLSVRQSPAAFSSSPGPPANWRSLFTLVRWI